MTSNIFVKIQAEKFKIGDVIESLIDNESEKKEVGAIATFFGRVREKDNSKIISDLCLNHYPGMTEKKIGEIVNKACKRWSIRGCSVIHRVGTMKPGELIVFVGVTSSHRKEAFNACEFIMDFLKTEAPFWKKEISQDGERWIESRQEDYLAVEEWNSKPT